MYILSKKLTFYHIFYKITKYAAIDRCLKIESNEVAGIILKTSVRKLILAAGNLSV